MPARWFVLYTEPNQEHIAAVHVTADLGFETMVPMFTTRRVQKGKVVETNSSLFSRYILVKFDPEADKLRYPGLNRVKGSHAVRIGSRSVLLCGAGDVPVPVPEETMKIITDRERARLEAPQEPEAPKFTDGQEVQVVDGPFAGLRGLVDGSPRDRVRALLDLFGRKTEVSFSPSDLIAV